MSDKFEAQIEAYEARIESELRAAENFKSKQKVQIVVLSTVLIILVLLLLVLII